MDEQNTKRLRPSRAQCRAAEPCRRYWPRPGFSAAPAPSRPGIRAQWMIASIFFPRRSALPAEVRSSRAQPSSGSVGEAVMVAGHNMWPRPGQHRRKGHADEAGRTLSSTFINGFFFLFLLLQEGDHAAVNAEHAATGDEGFEPARRQKTGLRPADLRGFGEPADRRQRQESARWASVTSRWQPGSLSWATPKLVWNCTRIIARRLAREREPPPFVRNRPRRRAEPIVPRRGDVCQICRACARPCRADGPQCRPERPWH